MSAAVVSTALATGLYICDLTFRSRGGFAALAGSSPCFEWVSLHRSVWSVSLAATRELAAFRADHSPIACLT